MSMVKRLVAVAGCILVITLHLLVINISPALACTSFAVYAQEPIYGMNFDWYNSEFRFIVPEESLSSGENLEIFILGFDYYGSPVSTLMMSNDLLVATQELRPTQPGKSELTNLPADEILVNDLLRQVLLIQMQEPNLDVPEVLNSIRDKKLVQWEKMSSHTLIADPHGNAAILEVGEVENNVLPITGDFIVMTNFPNSDFLGKSYDQVAGTGADRYITAHEYIDQHLDSFDIDHAFEALKRTTQTNTLCSMVFAPEENYVYVALNRDFDKLWKISITDRTMETYRGFKKKVRLHIPDDGIIGADLLAGNYSDYQKDGSGLTWKISLIAGGVVLVIAVTLLLSIQKNRG